MYPRPDAFWTIARCIHPSNLESTMLNQGWANVEYGEPTYMFLAKITFVVAEIIFKVTVIAYLVVKITFAVTKITFFRG